MLDDEQFDVFLAYYGNIQNGSEDAARNLYNFLRSQKMSMGDRYACTFIQKQRSMDSTEKRRE